jgi:peptide deformylase
MIIENIIQIGNPILSANAKKVNNIHSLETKETITNLIDTMRAKNLIGMAASQIGVKLRIFVTEIRSTMYRKSTDDNFLRIFINPIITWESKQECTIYESCGSVAYTRLFAPVKRPKKIVIEAFDDNGKKFKLKADGLLSRVIQHEYDHLN